MSGIVAHCDWSDPGKSPYQGTGVEWAQRLPDAERRQVAPLVARIEAQQFDAVVYADTSRIYDANGRDDYAYGSDIGYMAGGARGTVCRTTTRAWAPGRIESGMAYCAGDICAVKWSVCGNWSIVTRTDPHAGAARPAALLSFAAGAAPLGQPVVPVPGVPGGPDGVLTRQALAGGAGHGYAAGWGYLPAIAAPGPSYGSAPVSPVPEPATWAGLFAGLALVGWRARRGRTA